MQNYCMYCFPSRVTSHFANHFDYYLEKIYPFRKIKFFGEETVWGLFLELLSYFKIVKFVDKPDRSKLYNRGLIFFDEAKRRKIKIWAVTVFGKYDNSFKAAMNGKRLYFEGNPLVKSYSKGLESKTLTKKLLKKHGIPVPEGGVFTDINRALVYAEKIGYPLVVKPDTGSLSHHVSVNIKNKNYLKKAIQISQKYRPDFILERHIQGDLYRVTVVGKKYVFVCKKERANVVGDGKKSVQQLIEIKNSDPRRGESNQLNTTLHKIPINQTLSRLLKLQGFDINGVPKKDQKVYLQEKLTLSLGCDIESCTAKTRPENKAILIQAANVLDLDVVGLDIICQDITKPYTKQQFAVIEANNHPYLDMHQKPSLGTPDSVARIVWDLL